MKKEAIRHPKTFDLAARLGVDRAAALGYLTLLWDFCEDSAPCGDIGKWPNGAIARSCDWTGDPELFVNALTESGWLEVHGDYRLIVHDWPDHCQRWVRSKLSKLKLWFLPCYKTNTEGNTVANTLPNTEPSSCAPTEPNRTEPCAEPNLPEPTRTKPTLSETMVDSIGRGDQKHPADAATWPDAVRDANRVVAKLFPNRSPNSPLKTQDRSLILKACYLARTRLSEFWLNDAIEAVMNAKNPPKNRMAYFAECLKNGANGIDEGFACLLAKTRVPDSLLNPRPKEDKPP